MSCHFEQIVTTAHGSPGKFPGRLLLATLTLATVGANAVETDNRPRTNVSVEERIVVSRASGGTTAPLHSEKSTLVPFDHSPFPYDGEVPENGEPFLDVVDGRRRGHTSPRGGVYWENPTYSDRRALLYLPKGFDINRPALIVVYFHGNQTQLLRDVRDRQQIPRQLAESGLNAALVVPQFAVDALDSSAGQFWLRGKFASFIDEAAGRLAELHGDKSTRKKFSVAPVVIVAYSGGYQAAAFAADLGGSHERLYGLILMDAPYADEDRFAEWVAKRRASAFFVSAHATASRRSNSLLKRLLAERGVDIQATLPDRLTSGTVAFIDAGDDVVHADFMTRAWTDDPLKSLLSRIPGFLRVSSPVSVGKK
jgi:hypothetical protein